MHFPALGAGFIEFSLFWIPRDDNLALLLQHWIDMHSRKNKQFIRGPVVSGILRTTEKFNVFLMIIKK